MARPRKELNWDEVDKLCAIQATRREIASWFDVDEKTIEARCEQDQGMSFSMYFEQKAGAGKISLRRKQFEVAMNGNVTMLIWLGKNLLDQKDKQEITTDDEKGFVLHIKDYADKKKSDGSGS